jgi:hypothetical protein
MSAMMVDLVANRTTNQLEKRLMNLQLVAKFLGYLIFSPNWVSAGIDLRNIKAPGSVDALQQLDSLGLSLIDLLEDAWKQGYVALTVPWVTELLKMAKWDSFSQSTRRYRFLLAQLRSIQEQASAIPPVFQRFGPTMQIVTFYLESFFHETFGLSKLTLLPKTTLSSIAGVEKENLDSTALGFSNVALFASNPHVEDLFTLITNLTSSVGRVSPSKARKLRPSIVSRGIGPEATRLFSEPPAEGNGFEWSTPVKNRPKGATIPVQAKLVDAYFHQHREVKEVCEFTVNRVLKNVSNQLSSECIKPVYEECGITHESSEQVLEEAEAKVLEVSMRFLSKCLEDSARKSLELLGPAGLHPKVLEVAASLIVARGVQDGQPIIDALVTTETRTIRDSLIRKKLAAANTASGKNSSLSETLFDEMVNALSSFRDAIEKQLWLKKKDQLMQRILDLETAADKWSTARDTKIPQETNLRVFFELLLRVDQSASVLLNWCMDRDVSDCWLIMSPYLRVLTKVARHTKHGMRRLITLFDDDDSLLIRLIECGVLADAKELVPLLIDMIDVRFVSMPRLQDVLITQVEKQQAESNIRLGNFLHLLENTSGMPWISALTDKLAAK